MTNDSDYAYAAGIMDGDGCIGIYKNKAKTCRHGYRYCLVTRVQMQAVEPILWLYLTFGGHFGEYFNCGWGKTKMYRWAIGSNMALDFLKKIIPFLKAKQTHANLAIKFQEQKTGRQPRGKQVSSVVLEAEGILAEQMSKLNHQGGKT